MRAIRYAAAGAALATAALAGCAGPQPPRPAPGSAPPALTAEYAAAAAHGQRVYRLDTAASQVLILVDKTGPLARFGHRHVIEARDLRGFARLAAHGGRAELIFPVAALAVDPPALRAQLGPRYATPMDAADRSGTRDHMLGPEVLDASRFPWIVVAITGAPGDNPVPLVVRIALHGITRKLEVAARVDHKDSELLAAGSFAVEQSEFGIQPYSLLFGALRVKNRLEIRYRLVFLRWHARSSAGA